MDDRAARRLIELAASLPTERRPERLFDRVLEAVVEVSGAERAFLILIEDGEPRIRRAHPPDERREVSRTILGRVLGENRPLVVADASGDPELAGAPSVRRSGVRSVCAIPLRTAREAVGAIYLDHRGAPGLFPTALLETLHAFAGLAAAAIAGARASSSAAASSGGDGLPPEIVAVDPHMRRLLRLAKRYSALPWPVYVHGETGTGKELVARLVHNGRSGRFVAANCGAISGTLAESELFGHVRGAFTGADRDHAGLFEQAHAGTLFLDEVEAMPPALQDKLLRVLQDGEVRRVGASSSRRVDVRIVSASNEDLDRPDARFRRDLYYRLNVLRLDLPPLRERRGDLAALVEHLLSRISRESGISVRALAPATLARLGKHPWPGNVRELENALRRASAACQGAVLRPKDFAFLDRAASTPVPTGPVTPISEHVRRTLEEYGPRMTQTEIAQRLGLSRKTLWKRRKEWGMT